MRMPSFAHLMAGAGAPEVERTPGARAMDGEDDAPAAEEDEAGRRRGRARAR